MDIKQTASHLQRLGQPFDVIISCSGVERQLYSNLEPTDVEGLLNEVIETHNPENLIIQERKRNGSSNIKQGKYPVQLGNLEPPSLTPLNMPQALNVPADFKDYMISDLKEKNGKLDRQVEKLEKENEELKKCNFELEKENKYKDKEFELDKQKSEYEKTSGLAGIVETVSSNPALATIAATAIGRLMGIDIPRMEGIEGGEAQPSTPQTPENAQEKIAGFIRNWLLKLDEETATKYFQFTNMLARDISLLDQALQTLNGEDDDQTA